MKSLKYIIPIAILTVAVIAASIIGCSKREGFGINIIARNSSLESTDDLDVLDTLLVEVAGLEPRTQYDLQIYDASGTSIFGDIPVTLTTDSEGNLPTTALWPDIGVGSDGTPPPIPTGTVEIKSYKIVLTGPGTDVTLPFFTVNNKNRPQVWAADDAGDVANSYLGGTDTVYVEGRYLPEGTVNIYVVEKYDWVLGTTQLTDLTEVVALRKTGVTIGSDGLLSENLGIAPAYSATSGANEYDVWVDINQDGVYNRNVDNLKDGLDSQGAAGFVVQQPPPVAADHIVQQMAVEKETWRYGTFKDTFEISQNIWLNFTPIVNGGLLGWSQLVRVWVVDDTTFDNIVSGLAWENHTAYQIKPADDVSGGFENVHVQWGCFNGCGLVLIWPGPLTAGCYHIIIDTDHDNKYDPGSEGSDIVDGLTIGAPGPTGNGFYTTVNLTDVGFTVE